jgi:beta-N-acetylhexosaminidase
VGARKTRSDRFGNYWTRRHLAGTALVLTSVIAVAACGSSNPDSLSPSATTAGGPGAGASSAVPTTVAAGAATVPTLAPGTAPPSATSTTLLPAPPTSPPTTACNQSAVASWTVAQRAAQLIVVPSFNFDLAGLKPLIDQGIGGVVFLGSDPAPSDLASEISAADAGAPKGGAPLMMADEEGGGIQRLSPLVTSFPYPRQIVATMTTMQAQALGQSVGQQMKAAGVTVDLAPVLDIDGGAGPSATDPDGSRSFSADPATASQYGVAFAYGLEQGGVIPVLKHFPGLGGATGNTDDGPAATQPIATLKAAGLLPFQAGIASGAPAVMIANATVPGLSTVPASLSSAVIQGLLRQTLGFTGLVLTDSLSAGAISQAGYTVPRAAVDAIEAGADQILFGSSLTATDTAQLTPAAVQRTTTQIVDAIVAANKSGALPTTTLNAAVAQVLQTKNVNLCG